MAEAVGNRREFLRTSSAAAAGTLLAAPEAAPRAAQEMATPGVPPAADRSFEAGDLKGRFVYDGNPPRQQPVVITADQEFCGQQNILEENLVVNPANRGLANVVVWLYVAGGDPLPAVHHSYRAAEKADVHLDCRGCRFDPHICLLRTTQTLLIRNLNPIGDSAKIDTLSNPPINVMLPIAGHWRQSYSRVERLPARVSCSLHPWESGWLLVKDHPYAAVSNGDGDFVIKGLPPGRWTFQFWHEQPGYLTEVTFREKSATWKRGRVEFEIKAGANDLGDLRLPPSLFAT